MLTLSEIGGILDEYVAKVVPAMLRRQYHLTLAKGGPDYPYLPEQSHFAHILNGVFGLAQVARFTIAHDIAIPGLTVDSFRKALALYTVHEVHKDSSVELLGGSEFSIPLDRLQEEYEALGLDQFAEVDANLLRAANVHKRSTKHGDLLLTADPQAHRLWLLVRLADTMASCRTPAEAASSLKGYLSDLAPCFALSNKPGGYGLHYHEVKELRGVLSNAIHQGVSRYLEAELGLQPLLYFADGTLYLGPGRLPHISLDGLVTTTVRHVLDTLQAYGGQSRDAVVKRDTYYDFETFVYSFAPVSVLLEVVRDDVLRQQKPNARAIDSDFLALLSRPDLPEGWTEESVRRRLGIAGNQSKEFNDHWARARHYLLYVDKIVRALQLAKSAPEWFVAAFDISPAVAASLAQVGEIWARGGPGKYVVPIAYHFLRGVDFCDRPADTLPPESVMNRLHQRVLTAIGKVDTLAGRQAAVAQLGLEEDLSTYVYERLQVSFAPLKEPVNDVLPHYLRARRKGHAGRICSICNRSSPHTDHLRTRIVDDFGRVFSNRVLPAPEAPQGNRLWCPVCQLEFILRKLTGLGLPTGAHYKNSKRIYLYVLPTFSFTPDHLRAFEPLLRGFQRVTNLPVRDYGRDWGLPHYWLEHRTFDPEWIETLQEVLAREAEKIAGWGGQAFVGERCSMAQAELQPHYYLIVWEKAAHEREADDARLATRTEAWAKACFAAGVISGLTSCKVYVTERPFLPVAAAAELRATITLDGPPPALRGVLGGRADVVSLYGRERGSRSGLERLLDLAASLWVVTADVHAPRRPTKDKHIATRLATLNASPLAGATFYKEYGRLNEGQSPYSPLREACEVLLGVQAEVKGGEMMDLVERIARKCLEIALPRGAGSRGKARRYELVFREGVSAMRKAQQVIPEMRQAALTGHRASPQSITELKRLAAGTLLKGFERRRQTRRGEVFVRLWGADLGRAVGELIDILVDEVYLGRAGGSFARFLRLENALADGVYYHTDRNLGQLWSDYRQERAARAKQSTPENEEA